MTFPLQRLVVASISLLVATAMLSGGSRAGIAASPFPLPPSQTTSECRNLPYCYGIRGLWVVVPADGEASFLFGCPLGSSRGKYLLGGTASLTSSKNVRVWYEGALGAPIGPPTSGDLLFHAVTTDGKQGSFQPILGCIRLRQVSKRSTVSARAGVLPPGASHKAPSPDLHAKLLLLEPGWNRTLTVSCLKHEKLVGNWKAFAFGTSGPPELPHAGVGTIKTIDVDNTVLATIHTSRSVPYLIHVQVGAICVR